MNYQLIILIVISLLFSGLFSGIEIAYVSADKLRLQLQGSNGGFASRILYRLSLKPALFIGTTLVGNTITLVLYGMLMAQWMDPTLNEWFGDNQIATLVVQTVISTLLVLVVAEFLPKSLFLINPNRMLTALAIPIQLAHWILWILVVVVVGLSKFIIVNIFKGQYSEDKPAFGLTDLNNFVQGLADSAADEEEETYGVDSKIFHNAIEFKSIRVRECMIPRTELVAVEINSPIKDLKTAFIDSGYSKILVYKQSIDNIVAYCHSQELFKKPEAIADIMTEIIIVPETMLANELLRTFTEQHKSIALVVDEFGGTSGIATVEDVVEEIFGEIQDEHDDEDLIELSIDESTYVLSARHEIDYLNEKYDLELPEGDYDTLGGFILAIHGDIPKVNQEIPLPKHTVQVKSMDGIKIDRVKLTKNFDES